MAFHVVNGNRGDAECVSERARVTGAGHQCAEQTGAGGVGDEFDVLQGLVGALQGLLQDERQAAQVVACGEFGNNAAVLAVQFDLGIDFVGEDAVGFAVECDGGFIAGGFDGKD